MISRADAQSFDRVAKEYDRLGELTGDNQVRHWLVLRSSKDVYKATAVGAGFGLGPSPDPGPGAGVELGGGDLGGVVDLVGVSEGLAGQGGLAEDPPLAFLQVQPAGALGDEGVADAGMVFQPGPGGLAVVAGEVIGMARHDISDRDLMAQAFSDRAPEPGAPPALPRQAAKRDVPEPATRSPAIRNGHVPGHP
jgi:hypothetical protein